MPVVIVYGFAKKTKSLIKLVEALSYAMRDPGTELNFKEDEISIFVPVDLITKKSGENITIVVEGASDSSRIEWSIDLLVKKIASMVRIFFPEAKNVESFINISGHQVHLALPK